MSDAHQALSYTISADDRASSVFRGVSAELRNLQGLARAPLAGLEREWHTLGARKPLELIKADQALTIARTESELAKLNKTVAASGVGTKLQSAEYDVLSKRHQTLQKEMAKTASGHATLTKVATVGSASILAGGAAIIAGSIKQGIAWEDLGKTIQQQTGLSDKSTQELLKTINNVTGTVPYKLGEVSSAAVLLKTKFGETDPQIEKSAGLMAGFAKRAGEETTPALTGLLSIMQDYREPLGDVVSLTDKLTSVSQATQKPMGELLNVVERYGPKLQAMGFGLNESIKLLGIFQASGITTNMMGRGLSQALTIADKQLGVTASNPHGNPQEALQKEELALKKLEATVDKYHETTAKTIPQREQLHRSSAIAEVELDKQREKYDSLKRSIEQNGGVHATIASIIKGEIGQIEHAKSSQEAYSIAIADFGKQVGPSFERAFYHNEAAIKAVSAALEKHGTTAGLVKAEEATLEGQATKVDEEWHRMERTLSQTLMPVVGDFLELLRGGVEDIEKFTKGNASLVETLGGAATIGAGAFLLRKPIGAALGGLSHLPGLGGLSKLPGVGGGGTSDVYGITGTTHMTGSRANPIATYDVGRGGGGPGPGGAPTPAEKAPYEWRGKMPGEKGVVGKLISADHPLRTAGVLASGIAGFSAAGAPGIKQTPLNDLKAFAHGADPTSAVTGILNSVLGTKIPSVTSALGIVPNKLGFDPFKRPDLAVRYMLTGEGPAQFTPPTTRKEKQFADQPSPGHAEAKAPHDISGPSSQRSTQKISKEAVEANRELTAANARLQDSQETVNALIEEGRKGTPEYSKAVKELAEAEVARRKGLEELERAGAHASFLTSTQKQQLTDMRSGLNIKTQANAFSASRSSIEGDISKLDASMRAHPSKATAQAVNANYNAIIEGINAEMSAGLVSVQKGNEEIDKALLAEAKVLGLSPGQVSSILGKSTGSAGAIIGQAAGGLPKAARGGRVPGGVTDDTWTLIDPTGRPAAKVGGDELLVTNRHTEARVNSMLAPYGTTLGREVAGERTPHSAGLTRRATGGYVFPFPKGESFGWDRIDQGQDLQGPPGGPVLAIGPGNVTVGHDAFSGFGPFYPVLALSAGPWQGRSLYYGHTKDTRTGPVKAGDTIGVTQSRADTWTAAPAGWLELGFTTALGQGIAGQGAAVAPELHALAAGHMVGAGGGPSVTKIKVPPWKGPGGLVGAIGHAAVAKATAAANKRLEALAGSAGGAAGAAAGGIAGSLVTASEYGSPGEQTASGLVLAADTMGFAELSNPPSSLNFSALGNLPMGTKIDVGFGGHHITVPKIDKGAGGAAIPPAKVRAIDLTTAAARAVGLHGLGNVNWKRAATGARFAGSFAQGGAVTADGPTLAMFGEGGRETAVFLPHAALGTRVGSEGLAETPGNNPDTGKVEYHTAEEWAELRRQHTARTKEEAAYKKAHPAAKGQRTEAVHVGPGLGVISGLHVEVPAKEAHGAIDVPGGISKLSSATWKKVASAIEKAIKEAPESAIATGIVGQLTAAHPKDAKTRERLHEVTGKSITDAAATVVRVTKQASPEEALGASGGAISQLSKLTKDARRSNNSALTGVLKKDTEWAFKWAASSISRLAAETPAGQATSANATAVTQLSRLLTKAQSEGRQQISLGLMRDVQKQLANWHQAIISSLSKQTEVAKAKVDLRVAQQQLGELRAGGGGAHVKAGTARDTQWLHEQEVANNKAIAEMRKEQATITGLLSREKTLIGQLNAKLHRELKKHHAAAARAIEAEIAQVQAALGEAQMQIEEVTATIEQTEAANLNAAAEAMKAAYEAFKEEVENVRATFEESRSAIGTRGVLEEGSLHRRGLDFSGLAEAKQEQEGVLTPTQIAQAESDLKAYTGRKQEEISVDARERSYEESILPGLSGEDQRSMRKSIEELTRGINELENQIYDQTKETKKLTEATNAAAKVFGGAVGFEFNGQNYSVGNSSMSSVSAADIMVGV